MENTGQIPGPEDQENRQVNLTGQPYTATQYIMAQPSTSEDDIEQRGGYEMEDYCADSCYCIGFIFTLGLITLCCQPDDM